MRDTIQKAVPNAIERISYQMPAYALNGKSGLFRRIRSHIGFYPTPSAIKAFQKELSPYKGAKGSVQFPLDKPMPFDLVKRIVIYRIVENTKQKK